MSSSNRKSVGDLPTSTATFSYAQAAKGRPASVQSSTPASGAESATKEIPGTSTTETTTTTNGSDGLGEQRADPDAPRGRREVSADDAKGRASAATSPLPKGTTTPPEHQQQQQPPLQTCGSTPTSPDLATASSTAHAKEADLSRIAKMSSSEWQWEKASQASNSTDKMGEPNQAEAEKENDEEAKERSTFFVAAPVPIVNIWQQRREAQAAKAKAAAQAAGPAPAGQKTPVSEGSNGLNGGTPNKRATVEKSPEASKADPRRKAKAGNHESAEPENGAVGSQQPGAGREGPRNSLSGKPKDDAVFKKPLPRQRNPPEKARDSEDALPLAPPPVADSVSWPTPETAKGEEKRKTQERMDKGDKERSQSVTSKPHGKEKWTPVPYTPNVIFETQLSPKKPMRSGRGGREGGRGGGHMSNGSFGGDRGVPGFGPPMAGAGAEEAAIRGRGDSNAGRMGPPSSWKEAKRAMSAEPQAGREQRKPVPSTSTSERRREPESSGPRNNEPRPSASSRRTSMATQTDGGPRARPESRPNPRGDGGGYPQTVGSGGFDRNPFTANDNHGQPRSAGHGGRGEGPNRHQDYPRETPNHGPPPRERGETRSDRGRGGYRGARGGGNGYPNSQPHASSSFANNTQPNNGQSASFAVGNKSSSYNPYHQQPHGRQSNNGPYGSGPAHSRNGRRDSHSPSTSTNTAFGRYAGIPSAHQAMNPIQTQIGPMYEYQAVQAMSAMPYGSFVEQYSVLSMVSMQLEYYFSVDNLCKDMFLRKHMDSQGFVFLHVIANFNRIRQLSQDMDLLRYACYQSRTIECYQGPDGLDRIRRREGWQQWVLAAEERDPSAQTEGIGQAPRLPADLAHEMDMRHLRSDRHGMSSLDMQQYLDQAGNEPLYGPFNDVHPTFMTTPDMPVSNGMANGEAQAGLPPLSASVPDFSPVMPLPDIRDEVLPGGVNVDDAFSDQQVESLVIVIRDPGSAKSQASSHPTPARTFSNGSIDEKSMADAFGEDPQGAVSRPNGHVEVSGGQTSQPTRNANAPTSPIGSNTVTPPPVFWLKDRETPIESLPSGVLHESYNAFRGNALKQREASTIATCHHDMDVLYQFWSHFLIRNFNTRMYNEFRALALEDEAHRQSNTGMKNLVQYYDASLTGKKVIPDTLAKHYVELVEGQDDGNDQLGFQKLRTAWRNGALNLKNRKKIDSFLTHELKAKLER